MSMSIDSLSRPEGAEVYYQKNFIRMMESYMGILRNDPNVELIVLEPHDVYKFEGDFYGLLQHLGVENKYFITVMRLNNIHNPMHVDQELQFLLIPSKSIIDKARQLYLTKTKKTNG